jgi:protein-disulfide isomerase
MSTHRRIAMVLALVVVLVLGGCKPAAEKTADQSTFDGIEVGLTEDGYVYLGSAIAPVTIQEFTDFVCPYCARHVSQVEPALIEQYIRPGNVRLVFRDNPIASLHPTSQKGHEAAFCVAEESPARFWEMNARLFSEQSTWGALADPTDYLATLAKELGADMKDYQACLDSGRAKTSIDATIAEAAAYGYQGTPMFRLTRTGSEDAHSVQGAQELAAFSALLDPLIAGEEIAAEEPTAEPASQLPPWASAEGLAADPQRADYDMAGDAFKGQPGAPLTVVEFSDYQCPVCRSHVLDVQPALDEAFVATGKVQWVFKNLPLRIHAQASIAAAAAECAGAQAKFWPMHDALYEKVETWAVADPAPALTAIAGEVGLDTAAFATCLDGRWAMEEVLGDVYDAQDVGNSTPLFIVLYGGKGQIINGSLPVDQFTEALNGMLAEATGAASPTATPAP